MHLRRRRCRRSGQRPGCEPGPGCGSAGFQRPPWPRDEPAWLSGPWVRRKGWAALGGILQQPLQESVLVLKRLYAARQIIDLGFQQLHLLGQIGESRWSLLRPLQSASEGPSYGRVHHDAHDRDEKRDE